MSSISLVNSITNSNGGYRQRLYEKFLKNRLDGFQDYKVIELLLTLGTPRTDCKQQAKAVLKKISFLKVDGFI